MLRLKEPKYLIDEVISACCEGITGNPSLKTRVQSAVKRFRIDEGGYRRHAQHGDLYRIVPLPGPRNKDHLVIDELFKSDFIKLYENYFVKKGKPGRIFYDALMAAANEKCPFCGGIGRPRNLDHFLPKAHFPQFTVLLANLVPSCRDCNMDGKGEGYADNEEEQLLQPYLDHDRYFNEQWVFARYTTGVANEPGVIEYFVRPPEHWEEAQKRRVKKHFNDFSLDLRFSKEAGPRLVTYLAQIHLLTQIPLELEVAKSTILQPAIDLSLFVNHWERVMCMALMSDL
jgi:hypothetical protein